MVGARTAVYFDPFHPTVGSLCSFFKGSRKKRFVDFRRDPFRYHEHVHYIRWNASDIEEPVISVNGTGF
jgi:hypothetical protein